MLYMKDSLIQECLNILKREDIKNEFTILLKPLTEYILQIIYPYIYFICILVFLIFIMILAILYFQILLFRIKEKILIFNIKFLILNFKY